MSTESEVATALNHVAAAIGLATEHDVLAPSGGSINSVESIGHVIREGLIDSSGATSNSVISAGEDIQSGLESVAAAISDLAGATRELKSSP